MGRWGPWLAWPGRVLHNRASMRAASKRMGRALNMLQLMRTSRVVGQLHGSDALCFSLEANSTAPNSYSEAFPPLTPGQSSPTQKCQPVLLAGTGAPAPQDSGLTLWLPKSPHLRPSQVHDICATISRPLVLFLSQSVVPWSIYPDRQVPVPPSLGRLQHCTRLLNHSEYT